MDRDVSQNETKKVGAFWHPCIPVGWTFGSHAALGSYGSLT